MSPSPVMRQSDTPVSAGPREEPVGTWATCHWAIRVSPRKARRTRRRSKTMSMMRMNPTRLMRSRREIADGDIRWAWTGGDGLDDRSGRRGGFDSNQLNCAFSFFVLSYFFTFYFLFSYFLVLLFSFFLLSSYHISILYIRIFAYSSIQISTYSRIFKKCNAHEQYAFRQEDVSLNRKGARSEPGNF
jgi:hypothetical protein